MFDVSTLSGAVDLQAQSFLPVPNRVAFNLFGLDVYWYGICLTTGIILGFIYLYIMAPKKGLNKEHVLDFIIWCVPSGVVCARLYYVIFEWDQYSDNLLQIFNTRNGGLAIHGALIGGLGMAAILLARWKEPVWKWFDLAAAGYAIGQAVGRWGNYFNSEAHGTPTDLPWAIYADGELVHPTFLYESIWCFVLFIFLVILENSGKKKFDGQAICLYAILYSIERYFVEGLRTDSLYIGSLRQAQVISIGTIIAGICLYIILSKINKNKILEQEENGQGDRKD